ncbi:hypothetical protein [Modestobacter sp. SYSU DS0875]
MVAALATLLGVAAPAGAAPGNSDRPANAAAQMASIKAAAKSGNLDLIKDGPVLTADEVIALSESLATSFENPVVEGAEPEGEISAQVSVGLGRYVYLRMSPQDQRFILQGGSAAVATLVCLATAGTGCIVATGAAAVIAAWVGIYYNPSCWLELRLTYAGAVNRARTYNCR